MIVSDLNFLLNLVLFSNAGMLRFALEYYLDRLKFCYILDFKIINFFFSF